MFKNKDNPFLRQQPKASLVQMSVATYNTLHLYFDLTAAQTENLFRAILYCVELNNIDVISCLRDSFINFVK
jgi:hypothetical protein